MSGDLPRTFGSYTLLKLLAKGGMGEIFLARTTGIAHFEKYYAVKKLLKKFAHDEDVSARFIDEAKLGARLQHPNIVQVYDLGAYSDEFYMATEFVDGFDLRRVLRFCHEKKKRIPLDIALFVVREILSGLAYAHRQVDAEGNSINLIHRDISPQNVLVSFEGEVKIIDFGLAKSTQRSQETQANVLLGNFGYMSPEQARGQKLDVRTDVYSTGIVLFELATGTKRFVDENPLRLLEMVARPTPIMPSDRTPDIPKAIDRIYAGATAPAREDRYPSAEDFRDEVTTALHKLNPRATREHLAQFLNHLFLGGTAPPEVDNDVLNKSVAVHVQDLYRTTDAFTQPKEADVQDRRLSGFSDDAPQTGSHPLMRAARVGDSLTHEELTGGASPPQPAEEENTSPGTAPVSAPATPPVVVEEPPPPAPEEPAPELDLHEGFAQPLVTDPELQKTDSSSDPLSWGDAIQAEPSMSAAPTSVYEAPSWSGAPTAGVEADASPPLIGDEDVMELDDVASALELKEVPRQPSDDSHPTLELTPVDPDTEEAPVVRVKARPTDASAPAAPSLSLPAAPLVEPEPPSPEPPVQRGRTVVSTLRPDTPRAAQSYEQEPTVVVDFDSLPGSVVQEAEAQDTGTFAAGGPNESLIIDFEVQSQEEGSEMDPPVPAPPPPRSASSAPPQPVIRPAAQPLGRVVQPNVAKARPRPAKPEPPPPPPRKR